MAEQKKDLKELRTLDSENLIRLRNDVCAALSTLHKLKSAVITELKARRNGDSKTQHKNSKPHHDESTTHATKSLQ